MLAERVLSGSTVPALPGASPASHEPHARCECRFGSYGGFGPSIQARGFVPESEAAFQAVVDPYARAHFFLSFGEEGVGLEVGFLTFTSLPGGLLTKVGKMRAAFAKVNALHTTCCHGRIGRSSYTTSSAVKVASTMPAIRWRGSPARVSSIVGSRSHPVLVKRSGMRKTACLAAVVIAACVIVRSTAHAQGKLNVVTATEDLASISREIGGDRITVESIARGYQDPHFVEAKPSLS